MDGLVSGMHGYCPLAVCHRQSTLFPSADGGILVATSSQCPSSHWCLIIKLRPRPLLILYVFICSQELVVMSCQSYVFCGPRTLLWRVWSTVQKVPRYWMSASVTCFAVFRYSEDKADLHSQAILLRSHSRIPKVGRLWRSQWWRLLINGFRVVSAELPFEGASDSQQSAACHRVRRNGSGWVSWFQGEHCGDGRSVNSWGRTGISTPWWHPDCNSAQSVGVNVFCRFCFCSQGCRYARILSTI